MKFELFNRKQSCELLGTSTTHFHNLVTELGIEPALRTGDKHSTVLYSIDQLKELKIALVLKNRKYSYDVIREVLNKTKDNEDVWIVNISGTGKAVVCSENEFENVVSKIRQRNNKFVAAKIKIKRPESITSELQLQLN